MIIEFNKKNTCDYSYSWTTTAAAKKLGNAILLESKNSRAPMAPPLPGFELISQRPGRTLREPNEIFFS